MKFKTSYFSVSISLVKENLRRFWAIPVLGFLAYFLSGIFPILMSYDNINNIYSYIEMCLSNKQPFFVAINLILPIVTAVIIYRYLQNSSSVTAMHSMPFTRAQLFNSSLLSGLILIVLPLLANELILQMMAKPAYDSTMYQDSNKMTTLLESAVNIFTRANVFQWFWHSLLIVLVVYAISVLAGMVTGNTVMHLALAFGFNFLAPALYLTFITYCSSYLFGFTSSGIHEKILMGLSPYVQVFTGDKAFSIPFQLYYIVLIIAVLIISGILYQKREMEKAGDSIVFNFMIPVICYLIAYFGMSLMGYYFTTLASSNNNNNTQNSDIYFYSGLIAGAIIFFIIGRMIVLKTPRVFNRQMLKSFGVFALMASLFICSITLDLMGFESRVPSFDKVQGASSTSFNFSNNSDRYTIDFFKRSSANSNTGDFYYKNPENIKALIGLHQEIVNHKNEIEKEQKLNVQTYPIDFYYDISNPLGLQRVYTLTYKRMENNPYLKQLYESHEFKKYFSFNHLNCKEMTRITLGNLYFYDDNTASHLIITDKDKLAGLLKSAEEDFQKRTYEENLSNRHAYCSLFMDYKYLDDNQKLQTSTLNVNVLLTDSNTIKWLKDNGYSKYLECTADMVEKIVFTKQDVKNNTQESSPLTKENFATMEDSKDMGIGENQKEFIITDKNQIQEILNTYCSMQNNYDKYYQGYIVYKQIDGITEKYSNNIYYDFNAVPDFISDYFK
ncbi:ABC transporter permease family protein [Aminipila terrae]|uniref:ABC transporter permease n=1 Tax=Aminipila terrae TaxID=2697030 RepID=A0A6P1MQB9_9FIRM|nr:hypothetical protein [Aminipila terrae]QHI73195.1 hypothetical protein Ami3637_13160 [Aminipila terrae]